MYVFFSFFTVEDVKDSGAFCSLQLQLKNIFVLGAGGGAQRYFKVSTESEAVLGDSKWFQ